MSYRYKVHFEIRGLDSLTKKYKKFQNLLPIAIENANFEALREIDALAMQNLYSTTSNPQSYDSIDKNVTMKTIKKTPNIVATELCYHSTHACVVEFGSIKREIEAKDYGIQAFPIGKSQYGVPQQYATKIKLQEGKHFVGNALNVISNTGRLTDIYSKHVNGLMQSIGL